MNEITIPRKRVTREEGNSNGPKDVEDPVVLFIPGIDHSTKNLKKWGLTWRSERQAAFGKVYKFRDSEIQR